MKKLPVLVLILTILAALSSCSRGMDVYLLIGQSNMAGRGWMEAQDTLAPIEGVWLLGPEDTPVPAKNPLNQYSTIRKSLDMQQICPGTEFSHAMYEHNGRKILLVVNAKGGSRLDEWEEGTEFYNEAVRRTLEACKYGTLKGILWHQGCSDCTEERLATYLDRLTGMVASLRLDLGVDEKVPFIAGELGYWINMSSEFNEMIHGISGAIPGSGWVSAEGCGMRADESDPHFSREGQLLLGHRYAEKYIKMTNKQ